MIFFISFHFISFHNYYIKIINFLNNFYNCPLKRYKINIKFIYLFNLKYLIKQINFINKNLFKKKDNLINSQNIYN